MRCAAGVHPGGLCESSRQQLPPPIYTTHPWDNVNMIQCILYTPHRSPQLARSRLRTDAVAVIPHPRIPHAEREQRVAQRQHDDGDDPDRAKRGALGSALSWRGRAGAHLLHDGEVGLLVDEPDDAHGRADGRGGEEELAQPGGRDVSVGWGQHVSPGGAAGRGGGEGWQPVRSDSSCVCIVTPSQPSLPPTMRSLARSTHCRRSTRQSLLSATPSASPTTHSEAHTHSS